VINSGGVVARTCYRARTRTQTKKEKTKNKTKTLTTKTKTSVYGEGVRVTKSKAPDAGECASKPKQEVSKS